MMNSAHEVGNTDDLATVDRWIESLQILAGDTDNPTAEQRAEMMVARRRMLALVDDAVTNRAIESARSEYLRDNTGTPEDEAYNQAISDVVAAIRDAAGRRAGDRLIPTGTCWCGCGIETAIGSFFARGHDKIAEAALIAAEYGGTVPRLLAAHGYNPDRSVTGAAVQHGGWIRCPIKGCTYTGVEASVRKHKDNPHREK